MENASKALIIAGAILISIVLIAVGVMVVNGANGSIDQAVSKMSAQEKTIFNQTFESYAGNTVKGSTVRAMFGDIISNNSTVDQEGGQKVRINNVEDTTLISGERSKILNQATYTVVLEYNTAGLVNNVKLAGPVSGNKKLEEGVYAEAAATGFSEK